MEIVCPRCKKMAIYEENPYRPFCSSRCKLIDLGNWAAGKYALPSEDSAKDQSQQDSDDQNLDKPEQEE